MDSRFTGFKRGALGYISLTVYLLLWLNVTAQVPVGYYDGTEGLTGANLKTALKDIINDHTVLTYSQLWTAFQDTDKKPDGTVWDMYSDVPGGTSPYVYEFISDQCGNYSGEGICYNREHSFPKSWFSDASPMYTDLFHIVPTDGYVNGRRSNYPYGMVQNPTWTSQNGSRLGPCSWPGYSGTVFEPIDEYKGDFARGYFYMVTRYESQVASWSSEMLNSTSYPAFSSWALGLLMQWHNQDPVSEKELNRNNAIYLWQNNRNPFIDNPGFAQLIWKIEYPPLEISSTPVTSVLTGEQYLYDITTTGGNGSPVTLSCTNKPLWLNFEITSNGKAVLSGTPTEEHAGQHPVTIVAFDNSSQAQQNFSILVNISVPEITFSSIPTTNAYINNQYLYKVQALVDGQASSLVRYEDVMIPSWLNFIDQLDGTALLYGFPSSTDEGETTIEINASYGTYEAIQVFNLQVLKAGGGSSLAETFTNMPANNSSYISRTWTGDNNINWSATNARTDQTIEGRAICLKDAAGSQLESQTLGGGITSLSFQHQQKFTGSGGTLTLFINNVQEGQPVDVTSAVGVAEFTNIDISGEFMIRLESNGLSRIAIDNLSWSNSMAPATLPVFGNITHTPTYPRPQEEVTVYAYIQDPDGVIQNAIVRYGTSTSTAVSEQTMEMVEDNLYSAVVTEKEINQYSILATDNDGNQAQSPLFKITHDTGTIMYTLTIQSTGNGTVVPSPGAYSYPEGTVIDIVSTPAEGWIHQKVTYNGTEAGAGALSLTMDKNYMVTTFFADATSTVDLPAANSDFYPNPFGHQLNIHSDTPIKNITLYDLTGRIVLTVENPGNKIDTSSLKEGFYLLISVDDSGKSGYKKLFKAQQ